MSRQIDTGTEQLLCCVEDHVATVSFNRPDVRNALGDIVTPALRETLLFDEFPPTKEGSWPYSKEKDGWTHAHNALLRHHAVPNRRLWKSRVVFDIPPLESKPKPTRTLGEASKT